LLRELSAISAELKAKMKLLKELENQKSQLAEKLDLIEFQISEIEELKMEKEDDGKLEQRLKILTSSEEIMSRSQVLIDHFHQGENSLYNQISERLKDIEYLKRIYPELVEYQKDVLAFFNILPDFSALLSSILNEIEYDDEELNAIQERLQKLNRLKSKYSLDLEGLLEKCRQLKQEKDSLLNVGFSVREIREEIQALLGKYREINEKIRQNRKEKAELLNTMVQQELAQLEMKRAKFIVNLEEIEPGLENFSEKGTDKIEFYFSSNPGQEVGKIKDVVSGGELSRLMLVLKSIVEDEQFSTYIFDEIDSGIGGKTAQFVGEKMKKISRSNQVICISHLPQIVAFADRHFLIQKEFKEDQTFSLTSELNDDETIKEIARLMAGRDVNENVLAAAKNLLASARSRS
jgi:DNA repair protein RecN (Recombination protein N)